ncbi:MAG TPA: hypothetical protein VNN80_18835 [Polyangiaceae bacterium]|nr:hypothetical protein [Polyangiaceae bacterium]
MSSDTRTGASDLDTLLAELRAVAATLQRVERTALARIRRVERALRWPGPTLEVWTLPLFRDRAKPPKGIGSAGKVLERSVSLGFAPVERGSALGRWLDTAALPVPPRWSLVAREEYRADSGKAAIVRVVRLAKADLSVRLALAPELDALVRAVRDEMRSRVEQAPAVLLGTAAVAGPSVRPAPAPVASNSSDGQPVPA